MVTDKNDHEHKGHEMNKLAAQFDGENVGGGVTFPTDSDDAKYHGLRHGAFSQPLEEEIIFSFGDADDAKMFKRESKKMIDGWE
jgi:hypothetical protein